MQIKTSRIFILTVLLFRFAPGSPAQTPRACTNSDMQGSYGFSFHGRNLKLNVNLLLIGRLEADGTGTFKGTESESVDGHIDHGLFHGTYAVQPDCTGSATLVFDSTNIKGFFDFVLVSDGNEIYLIDVGGNLESGELKRQFWKTKHHRNPF